MTVLLAEDYVPLATFICSALEKEGYQVHCVADGLAARDYVLDQQPDLLVLDLDLPGLCGVEVLRAMEGRAPNTSAIVLTGKSDLALKVECLNLGADDYLTKPFSTQELTARCRAVRRRRSETTSAVLRHGELQLDRMARSVTLHGHTVEFTAKEFALLEYLMLKRGRPVPRQELLRQVWRMVPDAGTNVVDVYINYLRRKLAVYEQAPIIETLRGEGYGIGVRNGVETVTASTLNLPLFSPAGAA